MDIFGGVLDIIEGVVDVGLDIHRGHDGSDTQVTDYSTDGLNFVIDVLKGVTKFVGSSRDREIILKVIEGLDTTGRQALNDAARIESRDETTGITIYILDGLRLYGNLHMGIRENMLNKPAEKSNAAFLIKILKNGCDILNDIWEQDIEKVATASATCDEMCGSLNEWCKLLEDHKVRLAARLVELKGEKRKLMVLFDEFKNADIENDALIDKQKLTIDYLEKRAETLEDRIADGEIAVDKLNDNLSTAKAKKAGFIAGGCACPIFGFVSWLSGGYKRREKAVQDAIDRVNDKRKEIERDEADLARVEVAIEDAEIILNEAIKEGERLQKEMDDNQEAQRKNQEMQAFFVNMHAVAVEEETTANEIKNRADCLQSSLEHCAKYSKMTDTRFINVLKGCDKLMTYISDEKLKEMVTEESDKELVTIVQTKLEVMQGVSFVARHVE